jgi:hypothetical protein
MTGNAARARGGVSELPVAHFIPKARPGYFGTITNVPRVWQSVRQVSGTVAAAAGAAPLTKE